MSVTVTINGKNHSFPKDTTILDACRKIGVFIPTLCYHDDLPASGKCGLCVVKINGSSFAYACMQRVSQGMIIDTNSPDVLAKSRRAYSNFIDMSVPPKSKDIEDLNRYLFPRNTVRTRDPDRTNSLEFNPSECIDCGRCTRMCSDIQNIGALNYLNPRIRNNECISCGQCIMVCPTKALTETSSISSVLRAVASKKIMVLQTAPSVRVSLGEAFCSPVGSIVTGKMVKAAREMGFQYVFDTNFGADVTVVEEATELLDRLENKTGPLPMFTSCCPSWVNYVERLHTELIPNLSTTKSPHMIVGRLVKTYFANSLNINPNKIFLVSLMPCVSKKDEIKRMQLIGDVDAVLTTREFIQMINMHGIEWSSLKKSEFDDLMGECTGAGAIFGVSGGVAEASVRFLHHKITGNKLGPIEYTQFRGLKSIKTATIDINSNKFNIAVCNGISAANELIESDKYRNFQFIEVMACPGGCVNGGGQPKLNSRKLGTERMKSILSIDQKKDLKTSAENPKVQKLYSTFLGDYGSHKAHELLHTHFEPQETAVLAQRKRSQSMPIVGYGSTSGTSMRYGRIVASCMGTTSAPMNTLSVKQLIARKTAVFIISTIGDGEFPNNSRKFIEEIRNSMEELSMVRFAVCGLGSTNYKHFCVAGSQLSMLLEQHLAVPILPFKAIDTSANDKGEGAFESWCHSLCSALKLKPPKIGIHLYFSFVKIDDDSILKNPLRPLTFEYASIQKSEYLTEDGYSPEINRYSIKLPKGLSFSIGEQLLILPQNPENIVKEVLDSLKLNPNQALRLITNDNTLENYVPERVTTYYLFKQYLDLCGTPNRPIIRAFLEVANKEGSELLEKLLADVNKEYITKYMGDISTAEFIKEHVKYGIPSLDLLMSSCPHMKPRTYSVASSPIADRRVVSIIVEKIKFGIDNKRNGLCSSYLQSVEGKTIPVCVVPGGFEYPIDISSPIIMIAYGSGIASMMGLIQNQAKNSGPVMLIYGVPKEEAFVKLIKEIEDYKAHDQITDLLITSYDKGGTIQKAMEENLALLWKYWQDDKAILYYSGMAGSMPDDIKKIMLNATINEGGLSMEEAMVYNNRHPFNVETFVS